MQSRGKTASNGRACSGAAMVEFVFVLFVLVALVFGLIDFGRFISTRQVLINLSREGSNLALRSTPLSNAVPAIIASASPLKMDTKGLVIMTTVLNSNNVFIITDQFSQGGLSALSLIGTGVNHPAKMPASAVPIPQPNQTAYVTEVFYEYEPITPIGKMLQFSFPEQLYDVAYF